ncbi:MAG TPA: aromatic amino acid lyase [Streptosporangiaceae bacterium]|nr:aromatic amino acid lyase [Streptosporangiaceae bacterium]
MIVLDGASLTCADVAAIGRRLAQVEVGAAGRARASIAAAAVRSLPGHAAYGRTTGVGANKSVQIRGGDVATGLRLARSHATGAGSLIAAEVSLAMLAVRANQIAVGGSGIDAGVLDVLAECVNRGLKPPVRRYGAIGTGDLPALAVTALCLLGERDWLDADAGAAQPRFALDPDDMLAFLSSNAATLAEAAIACHDISALLSAGTVIAALGHLAAGASTESYAVAVQRARPYPGQTRVAASLRFLLAGQAASAARIQDSYGYRALPHVHGAASDAIDHAADVVTRDLNAAAENPLIDVAAQRFWHNGNFHTAYVALALDAARAAVFQAASLSTARLGALLDDRTTGLTPFLAHDTPPSSGLMVVEYAAHSALADIRRLAAPVVLGDAVLSIGVEEHAGFGTQAAWSATGVVLAYEIVLACELVGAVRALRLRSGRPAPGPLRDAFDQADSVLPAGLSDRPLDDDIAAAEQLLAAMAAVLSGR